MPDANSEAQDYRQLHDTSIDCFRAALRHVADYAIELEGDVTASYRHLLSGLAEKAETVNSEAAPDLMRDYRGKVATYVNRLSGELTITARSLQQILDSLADVDGDYEGRMGSALASLREAGRSAGAGEIGGPLLAVSTAIGGCLAEIHKRHEVTISQLLAEIRTLHKRIDQLESTASLDVLTMLFTRAELEERIKSLPTGASGLLLFSLKDLGLGETRFGGSLGAQLAAAFLKRLRLILPSGTAIGRWSEEEFVAILAPSHKPSELTQDALNEQLSGAYTCVEDGKTVRPTLHVRTTLLSANQVLEISRVLA